MKSKWHWDGILRGGCLPPPERPINNRPQVANLPHIKHNWGRMFNSELQPDYFVHFLRSYLKTFQFSLARPFKSHTTRPPRSVSSATIF